MVVRSGLPSIAVNNSWEAIPECSYIYAGDTKWWDANYGLIKSKAEKWTCCRISANRYRIGLHRIAGRSFNSGMRAIQFAAFKGFSRIILLGYDCDVSRGSHWHGDHKGNLRNPSLASTDRWMDQFKQIAKELSHIEILNASRSTRLASFPRIKLEQALNV